MCPQPGRLPLGGARSPEDSDSGAPTGPADQTLWPSRAPGQGASRNVLRLDGQCSPSDGGGDPPELALVEIDAREAALKLRDKGCVDSAEALAPHPFALRTVSRTS